MLDGLDGLPFLKLVDRPAERPYSYRRADPAHAIPHPRDRPAARDRDRRRHHHRRLGVRAGVRDHRAGAVARRRHAGLDHGGSAHDGRRAGVRRARRRPSRAPAASTCSCARSTRRRSASCGAGRCSGACTPASWRRLPRCLRATPGISSRWATPRCAASAVAAILVLSARQLRRRALRQRRADGLHRGQGARRGRRSSSRAGCSIPAARGRASARSPSDVGAGDFLLAVGAGLFAFGGWHMVTYTAEETKDPERTIPRALVHRHPDRHGLLRRAERRLPVGAADRPGDRVDARRGRHVRGAGRSRRRQLRLGAGDVLGVRRAERRHPRRPARVLPMAQDGLLFKWAAAVHPTLPHAGPRDPAAGGLGGRCSS